MVAVSVVESWVYIWKEGWQDLLMNCTRSQRWLDFQVSGLSNWKDVIATCWGGRRVGGVCLTIWVQEWYPAGRKTEQGQVSFSFTGECGPGVSSSSRVWGWLLFDKEILVLGPEVPESLLASFSILANSVNLTKKPERRGSSEPKVGSPLPSGSLLDIVFDGKGLLVRAKAPRCFTLPRTWSSWGGKKSLSLSQSVFCFV